MATRPAVATITTAYASVDALNANFALLADSIEALIARVGGAGSGLTGNLDANDKKVVNLGAPSTGTDAARLVDITNSATLGGGAANLVVFTPYSTLAATTVQGAIEELLDEQIYTPAGTGVTTRSLQAKLREVHRSVVDQGAVASTTLDSTTSFQLSVDWHIANRVTTMHLPSTGAFYYRITSPIDIDGRIRIKGDGEFTTTVWADGFAAGEPVFNCVNDAGDVVEWLSLEDITIRSNNSFAVGVHLENISQVDLRNVTLYDLSYGVEVTGDRTFSISYRKVYGIGIAGYTIRYHSFAGGGQHTFDTCTFTGTNGVFVEDDVDIDSMFFLNCNWEQCGTTDFTCEGELDGLGVNGGRSEGFGSGGGTISFNINPASGNHVRGYVHQGFFWASDSGNAYPIGIGGDVEGFVIQANTATAIGGIAGVLLNGAGMAGCVQYNKFLDSPLAVSANRASVRVLSNRNSSTTLPEYGGKSGTYSAVGTGFASAPSVTARYSISDGSTVSIVLPQITGTSNSTAFTITGMPTECRPAVDIDMLRDGQDNGGSFTPCLVRVKTTGVIEVYYQHAAGNWTASGTKTLYGSVLSYPLI